MRTTIASNGVYHPLTGKLGRTDVQQREADRVRWQQTQERAAQNLAFFAVDSEDYLELADALGLIEAIPAEVRDELRTGA